jgi:hypothetical protein
MRRPSAPVRRAPLGAPSLALLAILVLACGRSAEIAPAAPGVAVQVVIDGTSLGARVVSDGDAIPLERWLPAEAPLPSTWITVTAARSDRTMAFGMEAYADTELRIYREGPEVTLGQFQRGTTPSVGPRSPLRSLAKLEEIRIATNAASGSAPAALPPLEIARGGRRIEVDAAALAKLSPIAWRTRGRSDDRSAWRLAEIVGSTGPLASIDSITMTNADGKTSTLSGPGLADDVVVRAAATGFQLKRVGADGKSTWRARDIRRLVIVDR